MRFFFPVLLCSLAALCLQSAVQAQTTIQKRDVATGLAASMDIVWGPDKWIWLAERAGKISRINPTTGEKQVVDSIVGMFQSDEAGLLAIALHPSLPDTPWVYAAYTYIEGGVDIYLRLVRYTYTGTRLTDPIVIFERLTANTYNNGCRLLVTPARKLMMATGDAQTPVSAQTPYLLNGKVLRMNLDGSRPSDNPYPNAPPPTNLVWSSGFRDPHGLAVSTNGNIYLSEQGPDSADEVNIISRRRNYGWARVTGLCDVPGEMKFCTDSNVRVPLKMYTPELDVAGMDYYGSSAIPEWQNSLLMATLYSNDLRQLKLSSDGNTITQEIILYDEEFGRLRDVCVAPDGRVFLLTSNRDGRGNPSPLDDRIIELGGNVATASIAPPIISGHVASKFDAGFGVRAIFTASGIYGGGNTFSLQISDASGSFNTIRTLGTASGSNPIDTIDALIPCNLPAGSNYKFRIVASNPPITVVDTGTYTIFPPVMAVISPGLDRIICEGDSVELHGRLGAANQWSNGATGDKIVVRQSGAYWVTTTTNGCASISDTVLIIVHPNPQPVVVPAGPNQLDVGNAYASYQWWHNDSAIAGATTRSHTVTRSGTYSVSVIDSVGCRATSEGISVTLVAGIANEANGEGLKLYPHPVKDLVTVELETGRGGTLEIAVTDLTGSRVLRFDQQHVGGIYRRDIQLGELPGTYVLTVTLAERVWTRRVVKE